MKRDLARQFGIGHSTLRHNDAQESKLDETTTSLSVQKRNQRSVHTEAQIHTRLGEHSAFGRCNYTKPTQTKPHVRSTAIATL